MEATALEFLKIQVDFNNDVISKNIAGISNEEAMIFPDNNANPANFDLVDFVNAKGSGSPAKGYVDVIKAFDWNPQTVGKTDLSYSMAGTIMENVYRMRNNLQ